jgi:hypothetical protein
VASLGKMADAPFMMLLTYSILNAICGTKIKMTYSAVA